MPVAVAELAKRLDAKATWLSGLDANAVLLEDIALPKTATETSLSFLNDSSVIRDADSAGAVLVEAQFADLVAKPLVVDDIELAVARAHRWLPAKDGIRNSGASNYSQIHPTAFLEQNVKVGYNVQIGPHASLMGDIRIGDYCSIGPNVTIHGPVSIGNRVKIGANSVIGAEPFMYVDDGLKWHKWPSFCGVKVNDGVEIGAGTTIDHGITIATRLRNDVKIDNQVHIGHGSEIGSDTVIAARTTIAGEVSIGRRCKIGGASCISEGVNIADGVTLMGLSSVSRALSEPGEYASAWPVQLRREWWRQVANLKKIAKRQCSGRI